MTFWVDAGVRDAEAGALLARPPPSAPISSLAANPCKALAMLADTRGMDRVILSLDYRGGNFVGPEGLFEAPHLWPRRVIVMTLCSRRQRCGA